MVTLGIICLIIFAGMFCMAMPAYPSKRGNPAVGLLSIIPLAAGFILLICGLIE